jgi:hypothetical protein
MAIALEGSIPPAEAAAAFVDAYVSLPVPQRLVAATVLMPALSRRSDLPTVALEPVANDWAVLAAGRTVSVNVGPGTSWRRSVLSAGMPRLDRKTEKGRALAAVATTLLCQEEEFQMPDLETAWARAVAAFRKSAAEAA